MVGRRSLFWFYEGVMAALAVTVLWLVTRPEATWVHRVNLVIWIVFILDYTVRLARARDRRHFISSNLADLVAIMPLDFLRVARLARLVRLLRFLRGFSVLWRLSDTPRAILRTNGLGYALLVTAVLVAIGGEAITTTVEGRERYTVNVRYAREMRDSLERLQRVLVPTMSGAQIPLARRCATAARREGGAASPRLRRQVEVALRVLLVRAGAPASGGGLCPPERGGCGGPRAAASRTPAL